MGTAGLAISLLCVVAFLLFIIWHDCASVISTGFDVDMFSVGGAEHFLDGTERASF